MDFMGRIQILTTESEYIYNYKTNISAFVKQAFIIYNYINESILSLGLYLKCANYSTILSYHLYR